MGTRCLLEARGAWPVEVRASVMAIMKQNQKQTDFAELKNGSSMVTHQKAVKNMSTMRVDASVCIILFLLVRLGFVMDRQDKDLVLQQ